MAQQKDKVTVVILHQNFPHFLVWVDWAPRHTKDVENIEGVASTFILSENSMSVLVDPRYDTTEVAEEVKQLLLADVPDVFKEE